jgi:hypothetical protein
VRLGLRGGLGVSGAEEGVVASAGMEAL